MSTPSPLSILGQPYTGTLPFPSLDEIKARLGIDASDATQDAAIANGMHATIAMIEGYLGRGIANVADFPQDFEPIDTRDNRLFLPRFPVQSVTSVTIDGGAVAANSWRVFKRQGVLELPGGCCAHFPRGCEHSPIITVVYTAGYPDDAWPADLLEATLQAFFGRWSRTSVEVPGSGGATAPVRSWTADGLSVVYADAVVGMGSLSETDVIPPDLLGVAAVLDPYRVRFVRGV